MQPTLPLSSPRLAPSAWLLAGLLLVSAPSAHADKALAAKHGCLGCHAADSKLVGPSYREIAERHAGKLTPAALGERIRAGGSGQWGQMPMPPQQQVSAADATKLASWILAGAK